MADFDPLAQVNYPLPGDPRTSQSHNWAERMWNGLTGQTAEDNRAYQQNMFNLRQTQETNATNYKIAQENLGYQKELQEYNKALQDKIFEREDTSYQRTAKDMMSAGLNPLTMQSTNGAGEAIAQNPLNNQYQAQNFQAGRPNTMSSPLQAIQGFTSALNSVTGSVNSIMNGVVERDALKKETDRKSVQFMLDNLNKGIYWDEDNRQLDLDDDIFNKYNLHQQAQREYEHAKWNADKREWKHMEDAGKYSSDTKIEQMITGVTDWLTNGRGEQAWKKLKQKFPILELVDMYAKALMEEPEYEVTYSDGTKETKKLNK